MILKIELFFFHVSLLIQNSKSEARTNKEMKRNIGMESRLEQNFQSFSLAASRTTLSNIVDAFRFLKYWTNFM